MLAEASAGVLRHYPSVEMPAQMIDWGMLGMALATVYGPRFIAMRNNRSKPRAVSAAPVQTAQQPGPAPIPTQADPAPQAPKNNVVTIPGLGMVDLGNRQHP